ncbi:MAG: DUF3352 domain-containing protein [Verrucomicrobiota bacterium]|nr:DUF3352 domain-containing protein [Verrucomicrobiota bacterium]
MKKVLGISALLLLMALTAGGVYWWFFLRSSKPMILVNTLPADTVLYLELKDVSKLKEDFKKTAYYKIWNDPGVQAFVGPMMKTSDGVIPNKVLDSIRKAQTPLPGAAGGPQMDQVSRMVELLGKYLPDVIQKQAIFAIPELKISPPQMTLILAYDYMNASGKQKEFETALKTELKGFSLGEEKKVKGTKIITVKNAQNMVIAKATFGTMVVYSVGSDTKILEEMIERHTSGKADGSLSESENFKFAMGKVSKDYASLAFVNIESIVNIAKPFLGLMPSGKSTLEQVQAYKGIIATTSIRTDGMLQEESYYIMPQAQRPEYMRTPGVLDYKTLPLTSPATQLYLAGRSGSMVGMYDFMMKQAYKGDPMSQQTVSNLESMFASRGINLRDDFFGAFGDESAFIVDWPGDQASPRIFLAQQTKDAGKLRGTVDKLVGMLQEFGGKELAVQTSTNATGMVVYSIPIGGTFALLSPTISVSDQYLVVANSTEALDLAVSRTKSTGDTIEKLPAYSEALAKVPKGGYTMGYVNSKDLFTRIYEMIRTYAALAGAFIPPDQESGLNLKKIPETKAIAQYLSNSISTEVADPQGIYGVKISSLGNQAYGIVVIFAAGAIIPNLDKIKEMNPLSSSKPMPKKSAVTPGTAAAPAGDVSGLKRSDMRTRAVSFVNDIKMIEAAAEQNAIENGLAPGQTVSFSQLVQAKYFKDGSMIARGQSAVGLPPELTFDKVYTDIDPTRRLYIPMEYRNLFAPSITADDRVWQGASLTPAEAPQASAPGASVIPAPSGSTIPVTQNAPSAPEESFIPASAFMVDSILLDPANNEATVTMNKKIIVDKGEEFDFNYQGKDYRLRVIDVQETSVTIEDTVTKKSVKVIYTPK